MEISKSVGSLREILATRVRTVYPYRVNFDNITRNQIEEMATWCINNCKDLWREEHYHALYFQFTDDYDAMMFMLKFGGQFRGPFQRLWEDLHRRPVEDLKLTEGTVYGSRYHCVEPVGGSWVEMQEWCLNQFGNSGKHIWGSNETPAPQERWYMNNRKFWFRNEQDRLMFVMKWR